MTTTMNKIWIATGAFTLATSAILVPVAAQADTTVPLQPSFTSIAERVGNAGAPIKPTTLSASKVKAKATGSNPLFQNSIFWIGLPNPNPPPVTVTTGTFNALSSLPGWTTAYSGWFSNMNFEACVLGLSSTTVKSLGPYGTSTSSISTGGC